LKIYFLNRFFYPDNSATSQLLSDLAFELAKIGYNVEVVTARQRYDDAFAGLPVRDLVKEVTIHRVWTTRFGRGHLVGRTIDYLTFYQAALWRLWRLARRGDAVVVMTDPPLINVPAGFIARLRSARLVNWLQDVFPEIAQVLGVRGLNGLVGRVLVQLRDCSINCAKANVVLGTSMANRIRAIGANPNTVHVMPNWADGDAIIPLDHDKNSFRAEWGLDEQFVIGYSGNMGRVHEFETIIDAAEVFKDEIETTFLFIGDGAQRGPIEKTVKARQLNNFHFMPYQARERLAESLSVPDVHLISLRPEMEGLVFPSKLYGILAAGRPAIFIGDTDGELANLVRSESCGLAVQQGDSAGLVKAIKKLQKDTELRKEMGKRARVLFEQRYDRYLAIERWAKLINQLEV
jgi:colanic acid biosynthesis glycosyl transferase WcaI